MKHILLDYLVKNLYANGHNSRPLCRQRTIQAVLDISRLPSARSVTQILCHQSIMRTAMSCRAISTCEIISSSLELTRDRNIDF